MNERELEHWGTLEGARIWAEGESIYGHVFTEEEIRAQAKLSRHTRGVSTARRLTEGEVGGRYTRSTPCSSKETATLQSLMNAGHADRVEFLG